MLSESVRKEIRNALLFVGVIWCVFLVGKFLPFSINAYGVRPRSLTGLVGIPLSPFLHADFGHLISNTVPLVILLLLLAGSNAKASKIVVSIVLLGGSLLWLFGRPMIHVGASGLIYGMIVYLIVSGFLERRFVPIAISLVVGFLYGGTLLFGIVPSLQSHDSWEGHLCGAIAGGLVATIVNKRRVESRGY